MFPLSRKTAILGLNRPLIGHGSDISFTGIDHGFNGEGHAFMQLLTQTWLSVMNNLWFIVEYLTNAMTAILSCLLYTSDAADE